MKKFLFFSLAAMLILGLAAPVMAQTETAYNGIVLSVDLAAGTFQLKVSETEIYTVVAPAGFDLSRLVAGGAVQVIGILTDTTITASQILLPAGYVGKVTAIDLTAGTFTFQAKDGTLFTVTPPAGFDLTKLGIGDVIILTGFAGDGTFIATTIQTLFDGDGEGVQNGNYCRNLDKINKTAKRLADQSGLYYEQIMSWFCVDKFGFGEIKEAIKISQKLGGTVAVGDVLAMKKELGGWGKVKQSLGLTGKGKHSQTSAQTETKNNNGHAYGKDKNKDKNK